MGDADQELASLQKEAEELKARLLAERSKVADKSFKEVTSCVEGIKNYATKVRRQLKGHTGKVLSLDWCSDRRHLVSTAEDGGIIVWDAYTNCKEHVISSGIKWLMASSYGPSGSVVACGGMDNQCTLYHVGLDDQNPIENKKSISKHSSYLSTCKFFNSDNLILTASGDGTCTLSDVESATVIQSFVGHLADVTSLDISPTECYTFVSGSVDGMAMVWDVRSGECIQAFDGHESDVNTVRFHPCGEAFATGSDDATLRMFDLRADREICCFQRQSILFGCNSVDFSTSGRLLFGGYNDYAVHVWDALKVERAAIVYAHENRISCLKTCPDGTGFCTASWDHTLKVWA
ncbi:guanine nucleotide-binding protein subunit beta-5-like [Watersipora subatra]|uniref:guanine nucleotide-binding protein subunit beta-5-like n=1 Tax=Watersipora subatra TaxID=2589382 RepID=UPI00355C5ADD